VGGVPTVDVGPRVLSTRNRGDGIGRKVRRGDHEAASVLDIEEVKEANIRLTNRNKRHFFDFVS